MVKTDPVGKTDCWDWIPAYQLLDLPGSYTTAGSLNLFGMSWNKIEWAWQLGLYSENVSVQGGDLYLEVSDYSGVGAQIESHAEVHHGEYHASIKGVPATSCPDGTTQGFFYYLNDSSEIDVEILSADPGYVHFVVQGGEHFRVPVPNQSTEYHDYGFVWQPDSVEFTLDGATAIGQEVISGNICDGWTFAHGGEFLAAIATTNIPQAPGKLMINHWTGNPSWSGFAPKGTGALIMRVDSVWYPTACPADFDHDGDVDTNDLLHLLGCWGQPCGDVDGDNDTDIDDLLALLAAWGDCP